MTNSVSAPASGRGSGKRERLVAAACDVMHRQGVAHTTLADIAEAADVPVGNVYYYFKTKDEILAAVVETHRDEITATLADLERRHRSPHARLKALIGEQAARAATTAQYGCRYGTLCSELTKGTEGSAAAELLGIQVEWAEQQFRAMGRRDAPELAVELIAGCQGSALLTSALSQPELMVRQTRRLANWIDTLRT